MSIRSRSQAGGIAIAFVRPAGVGQRSPRRVAMTGHAVVIAGGGPTGLRLAGELALAGVDVAIVERRANQHLAGSRAGGSALAHNRGSRSARTR
jgi:heterodisulfide reductase subunit A-like polyferredoxin